MTPPPNQECCHLGKWLHYGPILKGCLHTQKSHYNNQSSYKSSTSAHFTTSNCIAQSSTKTEQWWTRSVPHISTSSSNDITEALPIALYVYMEEKYHSVLGNCTIMGNGNHCLVQSSNQIWIIDIVIVVLFVESDIKKNLCPKCSYSRYLYVLIYIFNT